MNTQKFIFSLAIFLALTSSSAPAQETACDETGKIYRICSDQKEIFVNAMAKAEADKKLLLVKFGADWCPWCRSLHTFLSDKDTREGLVPETQLAEIALYRERDKIPSGQVVLDEVASFSKKKPDTKGLPLLAVVDPVKKRAIFINTAALEKNDSVSKGHDPKKLSAALMKAASSLR